VLSVHDSKLSVYANVLNDRKRPECDIPRISGNVLVAATSDIQRQAKTATNELTKAAAVGVVVVI
jgi:hypothetical protein